MQSISLIGIGRAGGAISLALARAGHKIDYLIHRDSTVAAGIAEKIPGSQLLSIDALPKISSDVILITTQDPEIGNAAHLLSEHIDGRPVVLHTSGSLSSDTLAELAGRGCSTGSMHPLISISDPLSGADSLADAFFCIEGDDRAVSTAESLVSSLGARHFSIPTEKKPLYHAAAVTACGHVVALIDIAIEMLSKCGMDKPRAQEVLLPLIVSTVRNLDFQTPAASLTGSFARADVEALKRHLSSIETLSYDVREAYLLLGERSLDLAAANGADASDIQQMREIIRIAKRKPE